MTDSVSAFQTRLAASRRTFLFLFFRRGGSDLPSGVDPDADADLRQYDLRDRHRVVRVYGRVWRSAVICSARSLTAARTIFCSTASSKRGSAFTVFWCRGCLPCAQKVYGPIFGLNRAYPFLFNLVLFFLSFVLLVFPTMLMGATLPVLSRFFVRSFAQFGRRVGDLYATNTLGAVIGCAAGGFFLIPTLGMRTTVFVAAAVNLVIAAGDSHRRSSAR